MTSSEFTAIELAACAEREVKQRKRVYTRLVQQGKMMRDEAEREIAMMKAIAAHFHAEIERAPQESGMLL